MKKIFTLILLSAFVSIESLCQIKASPNWQTKSLDQRSIDNISGLSKTYGYIRYFYPNPSLSKFDWYKFLVYAIKEMELKTLNKKINKIKLKLFDANIIELIITNKRKEGISFIKQYESRIADIIIRRNIIQHFYPYFADDDLIENWDNLCDTYYNAASESTDIYDFYDKVSELMSHVRDSHLNMFLSAGMGGVGTYAQTYYPAVAVEFADSVLYINHTVDTLNFGKRNIIRKINGIETDKIIHEKLCKLSFSTPKSGIYKLVSSGEIFKTYNKDSVIVLTIEGVNQQLKDISVKTASANPFYNTHTTPFVKNINDSIMYMDLCHPNGSYKSFVEYLPQLQNSKGIILDMRGYPKDYTLSIFANLIDSVVSLGNLKAPCIYHPNRERDEYFEAEKWQIAPACSAISKDYSKKYKYLQPEVAKISVPLYFLAGESSISYTETLLDMVKYYNIGTIIGDYTAGCNGDIISVDMPFAPFTISGCRFLFRDGSKHHGVGIQPDIFCSSTDIPMFVFPLPLKYSF